MINLIYWNMLISQLNECGVGSKLGYSIDGKTFYIFKIENDLFRLVTKR